MTYHLSICYWEVENHHLRLLSKYSSSKHNMVMNIADRCHILNKTNQQNNLTGDHQFSNAHRPLLLVPPNTLQDVLKPWIGIIICFYISNRLQPINCRENLACDQPPKLQFGVKILNLSFAPNHMVLRTLQHVSRTLSCKIFLKNE